jgi:poly(A) polymerase
MARTAQAEGGRHRTAAPLVDENVRPAPVSSEPIPPDPALDRLPDIPSDPWPLPTTVLARFSGDSDPDASASGRGLVRHRVPLDEASIDADVARIVRRLIRAGHEAYLVGGCVRDLLLGRRPKDFDVATSARPEDVRYLFRNSRIIGRRFRLVHVLMPQQKVIEVATFRRNPNPQLDADPTAPPGESTDDSDILIRSDNAFGSVEEDAIRRDFTINALFYDIEAREILDFATGMRDIERRAVRTIGDPAVRFREDPVRILRAVKFAGRLDLGIDPDVIDAIVATRETLSLAAKPRLFEEILRLMRGGASRRSLFLAWETGILHVLLPELAALFDDIDGDEGPSSRVFRLLSELDARTQQRGEPFDDVILWSLLLLEPMLEACEGASDRMQAAIEFCEPLMERFAVHRRIFDVVRRIVAVLPRLYAGRFGKLTQSEILYQALVVAEISLSARGEREAAERVVQALTKVKPPAKGALSVDPWAARDARRRGPRRGS